MKRIKRIRHFVLALVWFVAMIGSTASASLTHHTVITFNIEPTIEVMSWPTDNLTLSQGVVPGEPVNFDPLSVTVRSNVPWYINVRTDSKDGTFRAYDPDLKLYSEIEVGPLEMRHSESETWETLSENAVEIYADNNTTGDLGKAVEFHLRVTPSFHDQHLADGRLYRVILFYTAGVNFP